MTQHPSDAQIEQYARHLLAPEDLLAVDDHLAGCEACRARAAGRAGIARSWSDVRGDLLPLESHLSDEQMDEYVDGALGDAARTTVDAHLEACATCAREVAELRAWARPTASARARPRSLRPWAWSAAAAAAAVLVVVLVKTVPQWRSPGDDGGTAAAGSSPAGLEALPTLERARVTAALRAGAAEPPDYLAQLQGPAEALMGASPASTFALSGPLATGVVSDRPTLRWTPLPGADRYVVSVTDEALRPVVQSPPLEATSWTPEEPLPRGRTYLWQVSARRGAETLTAPVPPAPLVRIRVVDEATARVLDEMARTHPESHLLLGLLYTQAGVRDAAERHLAAVRPADPGFDTARRTLERLRRPAPPTG